MKVVLLAAMTADGYIGRSAEHLADWTGSADKKVFVEVTKTAGVIVMGANTFRTIGRALPERRMIVYTRKPELITAENVETTAEEPHVLVERLSQEGAAGVAICGGAAIYDLFMQAGLIDELYITIVPALFGSGVPLFRTTLEHNLKLLENRQLDDNTVLLHYEVARS
jgi:dihydrofolate reductase